jgi:hypothetical protein
MAQPLRVYAVHSQLINIIALCLASLTLDRRPIWLCKESYGPRGEGHPWHRSSAVSGQTVPECRYHYESS